MPIIGYGAQRQTRRPIYRRIGTLHKGDKKELHVGRIPPELTYFRFANENNPKIEKAFSDKYGPKPTELVVFLPSTDVPLEDCWESWCEAYSAGGIKHRCNGVTMNGWREQVGTRSVWREGSKPCRHEDHMSKNNPDGDPLRDKVGRLSVVVTHKDEKSGRYFPVVWDEVRGILRPFDPRDPIGQWAVVTVLTKGGWDVNQIENCLVTTGRTYTATEAGEIIPIPFILRRVQKDITYSEGGQLKKTKKWMVELEVHPAYDRKSTFISLAGGAPISPDFSLPAPAASQSPALPSPAPKVNFPPPPPPPEQLNLAGVEVLDADLYEPPTFDTPPATAPEWMDAAIALWPGKWETVKSAVEKKDKDWPEFVTARNLELLDEMMNSKATTALESHVKAAWPGKEAFVKPVFDECTKVKVALDPIQYIAAIQKLTGTETPGDAVAKILADMTF